MDRILHQFGLKYIPMNYLDVCFTICFWPLSTLVCGRTAGPCNVVEVTYNSIISLAEWGRALNVLQDSQLAGWFVHYTPYKCRIDTSHEGVKTWECHFQRCDFGAFMLNFRDANGFLACLKTSLRSFPSRMNCWKFTVSSGGNWAILFVAIFLFLLFPFTPVLFWKKGLLI